jgi:hypothetical protein
MQSTHKCSFILRLWQADQSSPTHWRASVEEPETGKRIGFASLEQLFAFLLDISEQKCDLKILEVKTMEVSDK